MNVYDFDKTVYAGDSSVDFTFFCLRRQPSLIRYAPVQFFGWLMLMLGIIDKTRMKEYVFSYLRGLKNREAAVADFWERYYRNIYKWYLNAKRDDDVIISASPEFLLTPAAERLGVRLLASRVDISGGKFIGKNCHDTEKVSRFREAFGYAVCDCFYSDSYSDEPMANIAAQAYMTRNGNVKPWVFKRRRQTSE